MEEVVYRASKRGKVLFPLFACKVLPEKALFHRFHVISAMPLPLDGGRYLIVVNTKGSAGDSNQDMDAFFEYLNGGARSIGTGKGASISVEEVRNILKG